jgi:hypothetical protein
MALAQLGHHIGLHVEVNLHGKTVGGMLFDDEHRVTATIVDAGALGDSLTITLNAPIGGGEDHRVLTRASRSQDAVSIDDAARIRVLDTPAASMDAADAAIRAPVSAGTTKDAIRRYRELNGATLDEARAHIAGR